MRLNLQSTTLNIPPCMMKKISGIESALLNTLRVAGFPNFQIHIRHLEDLPEIGPVHMSHGQPHHPLDPAQQQTARENNSRYIRTVLIHNNNTLP